MLFTDRPETDCLRRPDEPEMCFFNVREHCDVRPFYGFSESPLTRDCQLAGCEIGALVHYQKIDVISRFLIVESRSEAIDGDAARHSQPRFWKYSSSASVRYSQ